MVAALVDGGPAGRWAAGLVAGGGLYAPHLLPVEVAHTLRRAAQLGRIGAGSAGLAHAELARLDVELIPYAPVAPRAWELRATVTPYDAWYVAAAELLGRPLATLDGRLAAAPGPRCTFLVPA